MLLRRALWFGLLLGSLSALLGSAQASAQDRPPNVIFFLSDDHRADMLSCAGHPIVKTPVLDDLARRGVRFENAFVTTSICAASRATLLTGLWERTHKYTFTTPPIAVPFVADSYPTRLRRAGYRTGFVGKFGVEVPDGSTGSMFDFFVPLNRNPYFKKQSDGSLRHLTDITGDRAIEFLRTTSDERPFCLSVSFNAAHAEDSDKVDHFPWPSAEDHLYVDTPIPPPLVRTDFWEELPRFLQDSMHRDRWFWRWDTEEKYQRNAKAYYRMISGLDRVIGRVLKELETLGKSENTVIIFSGDNGYYMGSRGFAGKWSHYDESLRVPLVIYDPRLPASLRGRVLEPLVLNVDIPATITTIATGSSPERYQGSDLSVWLGEDPPDGWRTDFFCEHLFDHHRIPKWEGVRGERYVYARYFEHLPEGEFLHDLERDPRQLRNLATHAEYAAILAEMRQRCDLLRDRYGGVYTAAKFPTVRQFQEP